MTVQPIYITFEQAKKLKEKGFDVKVNIFFDLLSNNQINDAPLGNYNLTNQSVSIPQQWQVVEWFRLKYGLWIQISIIPDNKWGYIISNLNKLEEVIEGIVLYERDRNNTALNSPQEAYSAAFDYILNNLI